MTNVFVCDWGSACTPRSEECIVTVFTGVAEAINPPSPSNPLSATAAFDPKDVEWGHTGSDREGITLQLDANLKPADIAEGTRTFPMDLWI